jgi:hypothetical protein
MLNLKPQNIEVVLNLLKYKSKPKPSPGEIVTESTESGKGGKK